MNLEMDGEMREKPAEAMKLEPLKNKKWLFPETGKGGFHFDDVTVAIHGLKCDIRASCRGVHEEELVALVEKWFPDVASKDEEKQLIVLKLG